MTDDKAPTRQLLAHFDGCHRQKFGVAAYIMGAKHATILARVWKLYQTDRTLALIDRFFQGNSFADDAGYSVEVFASQVPRLLMQITRKQLDEWKSECSDHHNGTCQSEEFHTRRMDRDFFRTHGYQRSRLA